MQILLATHNKGKIKRYKSYLKNKDVDLVTLEEFGLHLFEPDENGIDEWENAQIKAKAYFEISGLPSLSQDTGLYINNLPDQDQPGKFIQRLPGVTPEDSEQQKFDKMVIYYTAIAQRYGGAVGAFFKDVYCLFDGEQYLRAEAIRHITITNTIHDKKELAFPLCSIYRVNLFNKHYHDLSAQEMELFLDTSNKAAQGLLQNFVFSQISYSIN